MIYAYHTGSSEGLRVEGGKEGKTYSVYLARWHRQQQFWQLAATLPTCATVGKDTTCDSQYEQKDLTEAVSMQSRAQIQRQSLKTNYFLNILHI